MSFFSSRQYDCNKFKKTQRRLSMCSAVDRARFTIQKTIFAPNVSPHVTPLHCLYSWRTASVSFITSRCEHLQSGTTNSFILPQMPTLATNAANVKASRCPNPQSSRMSCGMRGKSFLASDVTDCKPSGTVA